MADRATTRRARYRARRALLQALYAWQLTNNAVADLKGQFRESDALADADADYFTACLTGIVQSVAALDALFTPYLDRDLAALDHVERAILRAGAHELQARPDIPVRVVISEWVALAKQFGAEQSFRYINGVLDRVARDLRSVEMAP